MFKHFILPKYQEWLRNSVINSVTNDYIKYLTDAGYSDTSVRSYTHCLAHFAYWLKKKNVPLVSINEKVVDRFLFRHLPSCNCSEQCRRSLFGMRAALKHLLKILRDKKIILLHYTPFIPESIVEELAQYKSYLDEVRGLAQSTQVNRLHYAKAFLLYRFGQHPIIITHLEPKDILGFIVQSSKGFKPTTKKVIASALRCYLRYRAFVGDETQLLVATVPSVASQRLATIPKTLPPSDIKRVLNAFDRTTYIGKRDYAMSRCLIDLGLRAGEVARLQIDDINWNSGTMKIRDTKSKRIQLLPLPNSTGKAIVDYLCRGRPNTRSRALFVCHRGRVNCPVSSATVCKRIRLASIRSNLSPSIGAQIYRHSIACRMLKAGASLKDIADVLRHRHLNTSMIYAKVDLSQLAKVAAPWPRRVS